MLKETRKKVIVIGSGVAGLACASVLAKNGHEVCVLEKNDQPGGRIRIWEKDGFSFDMGPSWYWMPEVFENFYRLFGKTSSDFYTLKRLDPGYRIYFNKHDQLDVPASMKQIEQLFEQYEPGSAIKLRQFLKQAKYKYEIGMNDFVFRSSKDITDFIEWRLLRGAFQLQLFSSISSHIRKLFQHPYLIKMLEFPVLFLGSTPQRTPALYSLMNYADLSLGTWFPMGGMYEIIKAMYTIAQEQNVQFHFSEEVTSIITSTGKAIKVKTSKSEYEADVVISGADYEHTDQVLLAAQDRHYTSSYWETRIMSPSSLLFYIGINKKLNSIQHHNLFFDEDFELHAKEIYETPQWPSKPLFYVCCSSKTDLSCAPEGCENLFFLIPLAPGLQDSEEMRERYFTLIANRFESLTGETFKEHIVVKRSYAMNDFINDYHSFKGNAYGLANTLKQTAFLKPKMQSKKIKNLFYCGQLTVPGPGVPPSIISGQVAAQQVLKYIKKMN